MNEFQFALQVLLAGIARGSVIGLVAISIVVVFTATRLLNFAAGEFVMVGSIAGVLIATPGKAGFWWIALVAGLIMGTIYAVSMERLVVAPLRRRGVEPIIIVIALLGVSIFTAQGAQQLLTPVTRAVSSPWLGDPFDIFGVIVPRHTIAIILGVGFAVTLFMLIRQRTNLGLSLRAVGSNRDGARVIGLNVGRVESLAFGLSAAVASLAGMLIAPLSGWQPTMGLGIAITAFIAALVGGITNPLAAFIGAMIIGILGVAIEIYISPLYSSPILFLVLVVVVLFRPSGIIPSRESEDGPLRA